MCLFAAYKKNDVMDFGVFRNNHWLKKKYKPWPVYNTVGVYRRGKRSWPVNNTIGVKQNIFMSGIFQTLSWMLSFAKSDDLQALQKYVHFC
jgi:hypothetical protein